MSQYLVEQPCVVNHDDGSVTVYSEPGAIVELSEEQAATVGNALRLLNTTTTTEPEPEEPEAEQPPARGARSRSRRQAAQTAEEGHVVSPYAAEQPQEAPDGE